MPEYRIVFTTEIFVTAPDRQRAREMSIPEFRAGRGDWEITYVGRVENNDEVDVTDNNEEVE